MSRSIDLNCDLGEGAGNDAELMPLISSANIACGGHAGDAATMRASIALAKAHGVAVGAHPGFPDREHFGRRELAATPDEVRAWTSEQLGALWEIARDLQVPVVHVKPHGALYNLAARDDAVADAIAGAVKDTDGRLALVGLAGSRLIAAGECRGLRVISEVFADRGYDRNGALLARSLPGALLTDPAQVVEQVLGMIQQGGVVAGDGTHLAIKADTVCLHGDGEHAVEFARRLRTALVEAGIGIAPVLTKENAK